MSEAQCALRTSFEEVALIRSKILRCKGEDEVPLVLVGNKCDLAPGEREVAEEDAQALAKEWGCAFMETSAKEKINNEECFFELVRQIRKADQPDPVAGSSGRKWWQAKGCVLL